MDLLTNRVSTPFTSVLSKLDFLRGSLRFILFWPIAALTGTILAWAILFQNLSNEKLAFGNSALDEVGIIARDHASHLKRTVDGVDQILLLIKLQWESSNGQMRLETFKERGLFLDAAPFNAVIVDRNGARRTSTFGIISQSSTSDVSDRPYFIAQKNSSSDFLFISRPTIGRTTGKEVIQYSRRLVDKNGNFDGIVLISVEVDYFTANYDAITLGKHGVLGTAGYDGRLRVVRSGDKVHPYESHFFAASLPLLDANGGFSSLSRFMDGATFFADKRNRYVSWQSVEGYSLIAVAGLDQEEVLAPYWESRRVSILNAVGATAAMLLFTLIAVGLSLRLAWRRHQLELARATYRKATESGSEGFYTARPIRDKAGVIVDFLVVDCNERGAAFFQRRREEFIGQPASIFYGPADFQTCRDMLAKAMQTGQYEGELALPIDWALK